MHDSDVSVPAVPGASIAGVADDAAILNEAYDSYADALYAYCRSLVQEPAAAADAVRDAFVVAAFRLADVPDESLLRPWLFAVARNECLRAIATGTATAATSVFPDAEDAAPADSPASDAGATGAPDGSGGAGASGDPDDARARSLPRAALGGLDAAERDFILMAWHGLDIAECAEVLGMPRDEAFRLFSRARDQLEATAGVLAVAGSGWRECAALNAMLPSWEGRLTPALRQQLRQHIDRCDICADQRRQCLRPSVLLGMAPDAMRGLAITQDTLTRASWVTSRLKERVLLAAFGEELESFERRAMVVRRAAPFRDDGFPVPLAAPGSVRATRRRSRMPLAVIGLAGTGLAAALVVVALAMSGPHSTGSGALPTSMSLTKPSAAAGTPTVDASGSGPASPGASKNASASQSPSHKPSATPSATRAPGTATPRSSGTASPQPSKPPPPAAPKISVSPGSLTLTVSPWGFYGGALTLTNMTSASLTWSISLPPDLHVGGGWNMPTSGTLARGQSKQLMIWADRPRKGQGSRTETVTLNPGNVRVAVTVPGR